MGKVNKRVRQRTSKQGSTTWQVRFQLNGRASSKTFLTPDGDRGAYAFADLIDRIGPAAALAHWQLDDKPRPMHGPTVAEWCVTYIDSLTRPNQSTRQKYRRFVDNDIAPVALGRMRVARVTDLDIGTWIQHMAEKGASRKTILNKHRFISGALNAAVRRGMLESNPARGIKPPATITKPRVFLTPEEFNNLLAEIPEWYKGLVEFLVESGCRWGEATALKLSDVDQRNWTVHINKAWSHAQGGIGYYIGPPKTEGSDRVIAVRRAVLEKAIGAMADGQEYLFVNRDFNPIHANTFHTKTWRPALKRLMVTDDRRARVHDLRHTHASWLLAAGVPLLDVSRRLGHSSIKTTADIYGHLAPGSNDAIMNALDKTRGPKE
jgi:integrase